MQLGTDIVEIDRIAAVAGRQKRFVEKVLTQEEREMYDAMKPPRQRSFLAGRFSAKEAYGKAFGTGVGSRLKFEDVSILPDEYGVPTVVKGPITHPKAKVSISHSQSHAVATVILDIDETELAEARRILNQKFQ